MFTNVAITKDSAAKIIITLLKKDKPVNDATDTIVDKFAFSVLILIRVVVN